MIKIDQLAALSDNYTQVIVCTKTNEALFVDTPDAAVILSYIKDTGVRPVAIFNTHHHYDHAGGNKEILKKIPVTVYASSIDGQKIGGSFKVVGEGDCISVGELKFKVIDVPGHTLGHIALYGHGALFCGDTLFVGGCGRLFEGTAGQMFQSLSKLRELPDETLVYCGHDYAIENLEFAITIEPQNKKLQAKLIEAKNKAARGLSTVPSTIGAEKEYNPFLRWESPEIIRHLGAQASRLQAAGTAAVHEAVFAAVRELRDEF